MADDFQKTVLLSVESKTDQVRADVATLIQQIQDLTDKQKILEFQGKKNSDEYLNLASKVRIAKGELRDSQRELDNTTKALKSNSNSLEQNRALLSSLTVEHKKLSQVEGEGGAAAQALGQKINTLTQIIKQQEKAIGSTNRNVGNYANDIEAAMSKITGSIPGLSQYSGVVSNVTKVVGFLPTAFTKLTNAATNFVGNPGRNVIGGFRTIEQSATGASAEVEKTAAGLATMAPAAGEAEAGLAAVTAGTVATATGIGALVLVIAGAVEWFKSLGSVGIKSGQIFEGVKGATLAFFNDLGKNTSFEKLAKDMRGAYDEGVALKKGMQDLSAQQKGKDVEIAQIDNVIAKNMLELRYKKITLEQAKQIDKETEDLERKRVDTKLRLAQREYSIAVALGTNGKDLVKKDQKEIEKILYAGDITAIEHLERQNKVNKGTADSLHDASLKIIAAQGEAEQGLQKARNRMAIIEERFGKRSIKAARDEISELAEAEKGRQQILLERTQSSARELMMVQGAYAKELSETDLHYKEMIAKEQAFIANQEKLAKLAKSPKAKAQFQANAVGGKKNIIMLTDEHNKAIEHLTDEHDRMMFEKITQSGFELKSLQIALIEDQHERQKESFELQKQERIEALDNQTQDYKKAQDGITTELKTATPERAAVLTKEFMVLDGLIADNNSKKLATQKEFDQKQLDEDKRFAEEQQKYRDQANVTATGENGSSENRKAHYAALQQQLDDNHNANLQKLIDAKITAEQFSAIDQQYIADSNALKKKAAQDIKDFEIQMATDAANGAFTIMQQSLASQAQAAQISLDRSKSWELQNTALTSTQKYEIEEKYRIKQGQEKVKEFKREQALSISKALIDGALGIVAAEVQPYVAPFVIPTIIAATATSIATIAAQKPPTYAQGGLHYNSDGKGSLLKGPGSGKSDSMNARLSNGEAVINATSTNMFKPLLSYINQAGGGRAFDSRMFANSWYTPRFASGGIFNTYLPVGDNGLRPNTSAGSLTARVHVDDLNSVVNAIANMPAPIVDVKDIAFQQQKLTDVQDRANY